MANSWMNHVKRFQQRNSNMSYREVLKQARKSYGGGIVGDSRSMVAKYATKLGGGIVGDTRSMIAKYATTLGGKRKTKGKKRSGTRRRRS